MRRKKKIYTQYACNRVSPEGEGKKKKLPLYSRAHGQIDKKNKSCESSEQEKRNEKEV
jgi:hypothetical protein